MIEINLTFIFYIIIAAITSFIINKLFINDFYDFVKKIKEERESKIEKERLFKLESEKKESELKNTSKTLVIKLKNLVSSELKILNKTTSKSSNILPKLEKKDIILPEEEHEKYKKIGLYIGNEVIEKLSIKSYIKNKKEF